MDGVVWEGSKRVEGWDGKKGRLNGRVRGGVGEEKKRELKGEAGGGMRGGVEGEGSGGDSAEGRRGPFDQGGLRDLWVGQASFNAKDRNESWLSYGLGRVFLGDWDAREEAKRKPSELSERLILQELLCTKYVGHGQGHRD